MQDISSLKIAVLQTGRSIEEARDTHGDYDDMCKALFGRAPDQADTYAVLDMDFPETVDGYDFILITGSKHGVYEDHAWIPPLEALIRQIYADGPKLVGICFGHQIIATALGGSVEKSDHGFIVGTQRYQVKLETGETKEVALYAWHQDQILEKPEAAEIIAHADTCPLAGLKYGDRAITFQPHPEFKEAYMRDLIVARTGTALSQQIADEANESLKAPVNVLPIQSLLFDFVSN